MGVPAWALTWLSVLTVVVRWREFLVVALSSGEFGSVRREELVGWHGFFGLLQVVVFAMALGHRGHEFDGFWRRCGVVAQ